MASAYHAARIIHPTEGRAWPVSDAHGSPPRPCWACSWRHPAWPPSLVKRTPSCLTFLRPAESFAPVELELSGSLPRSGEFVGARFTVERAHVTNTHPYTMFGDPRPGPLFYAVLAIVAENPTRSVIDYGFDDEAFALRTWSGRLLPNVPSPGRLAFSRLAPGDRTEDELVFGSETPDILDGAALLVGRPPDVPAIVPLTAPPLPADYPAPVTAEEQGPFQAGAIAWEVLSGEASLDRPPGACCPDSGVRADEGEVFLTLRLRGRVDGSQYGQATVSTDAVRLLVGG
jgi:hypothetical protein